MEVPVAPAVVGAVLRELQARNAAERGAFEGVVGEYMAVLERCHVLEVRVGQLEKEAGELQAENKTLATSVAVARESVAQGEEVKALEAKVLELNTELAGAYRDKSKLAEDMLGVTRQLAIVRENNEMQAKELNQDKDKLLKLTMEVKELRKALDAEKAARSLASEELQACRTRREEVERELEAQQASNQQLVDRIVAMKVEQAELLNQAVQEHDSAVRTAEQLRRGAAAEMAGRRGSGEQAREGEAPGEGFIRRGFHLMRMGSASGAHPQPTAASEEPVEVDYADAYPFCSETNLPTQVLNSIMPAHTGGCYSLEFSRSGMRLASAGADKCARIWDPDSGTGLTRLEGTQGTVLDTSWTCDDRYLLGAGSDHSLRLWDAASGRVRHVLTGHTDKVSTVKCSPADPLRAVSGSNDRSVKIWDLHRGHIARTIVCHSTVNAVCMSMDGQVVMSGHFDGALRFWDLRSGSPINEVTGLHTQQIMSVAICNRSNAVLTSSRDNSLKLVNLGTQEVVKVVPCAAGHLACRACISPDDKYIACGLSDGGIAVWDREGGTAPATILRHSTGHKPGAQLLDTAWSSNGQQLASSDRSGAIVVWR